MPELLPLVLLIMKTNNLTADVIGRLIPNVLTEAPGETSLVDKLAPFIEAAKARLETEYLGSEDFLSDGHNAFAQSILVKMAFADAVPSLDLVVSPSGMAVINTDNMAPASKERVERLVASLRDYVRVNIPVLLDICRSYEVWRQSERGRYFGASFINSPKFCEGLDMPFEEVRRRAVRVEAALAERYLGHDMMAALRDDFNSNVIPQSHPLVDACICLVLSLITSPKQDAALRPNALWHAARPVIAELAYYPEYKALWVAEMGDTFKEQGFVNNVKGGYYF